MGTSFRRRARRLAAKLPWLRESVPVGGILTTTQQSFLRWNAERLGIPVEESRRRYEASLQAVGGNHGSPEYRQFCMLSHETFQVFFGDSLTDNLYDAYRFHGHLHFLRMLSYPEPKWSDADPVIRPFLQRASVTIVDYGCGLAQRSRTLAEYLKARGIDVRLFLIDIATLRRDFLLWLGRVLEFRRRSWNALTPIRFLNSLPATFASPSIFLSMFMIRSRISTFFTRLLGQAVFWRPISSITARNSCTYLPILASCDARLLALTTKS